MIFVGQLCTAEALAAVSLATSIANVFGHSVMVGLSSALATIASQAYGAGDFCTMNHATYKSIFVLLTACLPISIFFNFATPLLILCGQDAEVSLQAGRYLRAFIPR